MLPLRFLRLCGAFFFNVNETGIVLLSLSFSHYLCFFYSVFCAKSCQVVIAGDPTPRHDKAQVIGVVFQRRQLG